MTGLAASEARRKEMLALSSDFAEVGGKVGGMSRVDRAKSGAGAGGNAVIGMLRSSEDSKADGDHAPDPYLVANGAFASESKFQICEDGREKDEMFVNGCRLEG